MAKKKKNSKFKEVVNALGNAGFMFMFIYWAVRSVINLMLHQGGFYFNVTVFGFAILYIFSMGEQKGKQTRE